MVRTRAFRFAAFSLLAAGSLLAGSPVALSARLLLASGDIERADRLVRAALSATPNDAELRCGLGDILLRRADFDAANSAYKSALQLDSNLARAYFGLSRIADLEFRRKDARELITRAHLLDPRDREIVSALVEARPNPRQTRLGSKYTRYQVKLTGFHPVSSTADGLLIAARINGSKPLRLIFDTGASGIVIDGKAARDMDLVSRAESRVGGFGTQAPRSARIAIAKTVSFGDLEFENCPVEIRDGKLTHGAEGVVGANLFEEFVIRLDARSRVLELTPFAGETEYASDRANSVPVFALRHLLLVRTKINRERDGLFLLDTGSAFTSISDEIARHWSRRSEVPVLGARGLLSHVYHVPPVELQFAERPVIDPAPIAFDLRQMSLQEGIEISGILGYPLLSKSTVSINYRDGIVRFTGDRVR